MASDCARPECGKPSKERGQYCSDRCSNLVRRGRQNARRKQERATARAANPHATETDRPAAMTVEEFREEAGRLLEESGTLRPVPEHIKAVCLEDMGFSTPQHAVACFSDWHVGGLVDPRVTGGIGGYNVDIALERLARWRDGVLRFTQMVSLTTKVPELHILALGDDMEGNGHMFGSQAIQTEVSAYFQYLLLVEHVSSVLIDFLARFEKIHVYKVFGNHGRLAGRAKDNYDPDNMELMAWNTIAERVERIAPGRFTFDISASFFMLVDICGYSFYLRHGDGTSLVSTYVGALDNKLAMNSIVGEVINYFVLAHHHTASEREEEIEGNVISSGCFVGPSLFALKMRRPRANRPSQEMFFVHPKYGITHRHRIHLATVDEIRAIPVVARGDQQKALDRRQKRR